MKTFLALVLFIFSSCSCVALEKNSRIELIERTTHNYKMNIELDTGLTIENITYKKLKLNHEWVLFLNEHLGTKFKNKNKLSINDHKELIKTIIIFLKNKGLAPIDRIHFDIRSEQSILDLVVNAIKESIVVREDLIENKDRRLTNLIKTKISNSELIQTICEASALQNMQCSQKAIGSNPIAFQHKLLGKQWKAISNLDDAGLHLKSGFTLNFEN